MFPYIYICGGQARPRWTRQKPLSPCQLPCPYTQMSSGVEIESSTYDIIVFVSLNTQQKLTGSLGPSTSS